MHHFIDEQIDVRLREVEVVMVVVKREPGLTSLDLNPKRTECEGNLQVTIVLSAHLFSLPFSADTMIHRML